MSAALERWIGRTAEGKAYEQRHGEYDSSSHSHRLLNATTSPDNLAARFLLAPFRAPQVAVVVEAMPVAGRRFAGVSLLGSHLVLAKGKLQVKPLSNNTPTQPKPGKASGKAADK